MFEFFIAFFIFCIILFVYLHINFHLKTSNDLEVYELDQVSKDKLEEICDLRQPVLFDFFNGNEEENGSRIIEHSNKSYLMNNYHAFEMKIRNTKDTNYDSEIYIPLPLHSTTKLMNEDKEANYFSENNIDFLQETGIIKHFQYNDSFLRPYMVSNCNYDVMLASENTTTPFRYEINYRNYFLVTSGSVIIKLAPPKSSKYLYTDYDYENFEFRSPVNPWNPQTQYISDFDKIKCLEVTLTKGKIVQIPAYWWYSIQFSKDTSVSCFRYRTYMNNIAIVPHIVLHALQLQNIKHNSIKKMDIQELKRAREDSNPLKENIVPKEPEPEPEPESTVAM